MPGNSANSATAAATVSRMTNPTSTAWARSEGRDSRCKGPGRQMQRAAKPSAPISTAKAARPGTGRAAPSSRTIAAVTTASPAMKDAVTATVMRADCHKDRSGNMRQRVSVPINRPNPVVWAVAIPVIPDRRAALRLTPVFSSR